MRIFIGFIGVMLLLSLTLNIYQADISGDVAEARAEARAAVQHGKGLALALELREQRSCAFVRGIVELAAPSVDERTLAAMLADEYAAGCYR